MKRFLVFLLASVMLLGLIACSNENEMTGGTREPNSSGTNLSTQKPGDGTAGLKQNTDGFYEIYTAEDLVAYSQLLEQYVSENAGNKTAIELTQSAILMADIDLSGLCGEGSSFTPLGGPYLTERDGKTREVYGLYTGKFEGGGHTISGIYVDADERGVQSAALFAAIGREEAEICNLTIANSIFKAPTSVASIAASMSGGEIHDVAAAETVSVISTAPQDAASRGVTAGIAAIVNEAGYLYRCVNRANISGMCAGGILGTASRNVYVFLCDNYGSITGTNVGGIAYRHSGSSYYDGIILSCVNYGDITGTEGEVGGIISDNHTTLRYCVNAGHVTRVGERGSVNAIYPGSDGSVQCCGNVGRITCSDPSKYSCATRFAYSWEMGTVDNMSDADFAKLRGYNGEHLMGKDPVFTAMDASALADGTLLAELCRNKAHNFWSQGDHFPVWDGKGDLADYERIANILGLSQ